MLGLVSPASERLEIRRVQEIARAGDELVHQRLKAYLGGSADWFASREVPGKSYFVFKALKVVCFDRAAYLLSSSDSGITGFPLPETVNPEAGAFPRLGYDARLEHTACRSR